jgi:maltooligosyltrehalose trehalohydrolase
MDRQLPIGAELLPEGVHFRVWAPKARSVAVEFIRTDGSSERAAELAAEPDGYFSGFVRGAKAGARYEFRLPHGAFPDPASRFQPEGPHGASQVMDRAFAWTDANWRGRPVDEFVIYELHIGSFTPEGTWRSAMAQLPELARLGITALEIMPVAYFGGRFGWGYDGVDLFAPTRLYGTPDEMRAFIDRAHQLGIAVLLDVVYNHLGPEGNYLPQYADAYFTKKYACEWGDAINFDGPDAGPVREFFVANARYWIDEFHADGLRLDATQQIFDASTRHILADIGAAARAAAPNRQIYLLAENEPQHSRLVRPLERGGCGLDAVWNDDFHHSAMVAATGRAECYYMDYRGTAQEFVSAAKYGFLHQGQMCRWQQKRRGTPALDLPPRKFVNFLQNHDQVANTLRGLRLHELTSPGKYRALTALLLLLPSTPLLFQGQEFAASAPFLYFADHEPGLRERVRSGRTEFLSQFRTIATAEARAVLHDPGDENTFRQTKLDFSEREKHAPVYRLHADLLCLRREERAVRAPARLDGAVLGRDAFVLRFFSADGEDRLLLVNLGTELYFDPAPEPLLAPLENRGWRIAWSSEAVEYDGAGTSALETQANWILPGHAAVLVAPSPSGEFSHVRFTEKD